MNVSVKFPVLSSLSRSVVNPPLLRRVERGIPGLVIADRETQKLQICVPFSHFACGCEWSCMFLFMCTTPFSSLKLSKAHSAIPKCHISEQICLLSLLPMWLEYNVDRFLTPVFSIANPDDFPHLVSTGSKISGSAAAAAATSGRLAVQRVLSVRSDLTHQFVWFVAVWSSEPQHRRAF